MEGADENVRIQVAGREVSNTVDWEQQAEITAPQHVMETGL